LLGVSRRRYRGVAQLQNFGVDADLPAAAPWWRVAESQIAAGRDQGAANAEVSQYRQRRIGGVSLGNASHVELHASLLQRHCAIRCVQAQFAISAAATGFVERRAIRQAIVLPRLSPQPDYRSQRDIEGAACLLG